MPTAMLVVTAMLSSLLVMASGEPIVIAGKPLSEWDMLDVDMSAGSDGCECLTDVRALLAQTAPQLFHLLRRHGFSERGERRVVVAPTRAIELQPLLQDLLLERHYAVQWQQPIGEGSFGAVFRADDRLTGRPAAIKRTKLEVAGEGEGIPASSIREVAALKATAHPNVVQLLDVICEHGGMDLVLEYLPANLAQHMKRHRFVLEPQAVCSLQQQLLKGLAFCHICSILHRDLKPANLLIQDARPGGHGNLKIADFGLARMTSFGKPRYTPGMVTAWYRPPEIFFGGKYSSPVDVWSAACIFGEMVRGLPLFHGKSDIEVIFSIFRKLGAPRSVVFPQAAFPDFKPSFPQFQRRSWEDICGPDAELGPEGVQLLEDMLQYDPSMRISAKGALGSAYFAGAAAQ